MKMRGAVTLLILFLLITFPVLSQEAEESKGTPDFLLIPIFETAFSGSLRWRPDWPADIPPDGFALLKNSKQPAVIELFNETENFTVKRDSDGRLVEFPFFLIDGYAMVESSYTVEGALQNMSVSVKNFASQDSDAQSEEKTWDVEFPADFLPYSDLSPGGTFPPLKITSDEDVFYVFIFESPSFLTETWYDGEGDMLVFCKAVISNDGEWRVTSLQIHESQPDASQTDEGSPLADNLRFEDYYFDSYGNITEIRLDDMVFSAVYMDNRPCLWRNDLQYELQWDTQGILTVIKASGESEDLNIEYRYEYERDTSGNWVKRQEIAFKDRFGLLAPQPSFSRGIWNRRIGD